MDATEAARFSARQAAEQLGEASAVLVFLFFADRHIADAPLVLAAVREVFGSPRSGVQIVGMSVEGVIGGESELERVPGVSVLAIAGDAIRARVQSLDDMPSLQDSDQVGEFLDLDDDARAIFLFADPFSVPITTLLPALAGARPAAQGPDAIPILGGMASGATKPGANAIVLGPDRIASTGGVIVTLSGPVRVDPVVSQGCRPFGPTLVVTDAKNQLVRTLGGHPALQTLEGAIQGLDEPDRSLLSRGVYVGRAATEYKDRFGRGDFLIRKVVGVEKTTGALAVEDLMRTGQTVQFHLRDARTADEDLAMLLDGQKLYERPEGVLLLTCNGRGTRLFDEPNHDATAVTRAFESVGAEASGESTQPVPLAGCFAAGEIGPVGDGVFLHGQSACLAIFRRPS